jgi:hypothetical protein
MGAPTMADTITQTVVNGVVLERLSTDALINFAADLSEQGREANREGDETFAADAWEKLQIVEYAIYRRNA